jgi:DNA repair ATPase RecN
VDACRFGRPQDRSQVVRIFDSVEKHEKWFLTSGLRPIENLLRCVVGFCGDESDHSLMMATRRQAIEGRRRFNVNGNSLRLRQLHEIGKLPISPKQEQPLKRTGAGA